ncbi:crossover junction endodeoxyribonuclease RuvC [Pseudoclavibacter sp. CFCC 13796]|uniref:crossover junction endodeoxyribonuclease RuvC n=1 Tax=Pseudoclavibacter sp. CFCC 13796 TaxID=2615179 RepID=UPI0013010ED8|nr:crossover junction endodeoxyribonuclease RuvC [Pseudoclavibacter sp. CFCC 13796]KAB1661666.1 crossover junction endodeoxyribonuclease RuvC [Pseudoclavibacter sp. CFCC 13796]
MSAAKTVVGLDLSLTGTGLARVVKGGLEVKRIGSSGSADATLSERSGRLHFMAERILDWTGTPVLVAIESPAYRSFSGHAHDRSGLWWSVVSALFSSGVTVAEVPPATLKKYATGKGTANKDAMIAAMVRRFPDVDINDNNIADAVALGCVAARLVDQPIDGVLSQARGQAWKTITDRMGDLQIG